MPTGGSGSPFFAGDKGKRPPENGRAGCGVGRLSRGDGSLFPGLRGFMRAFPKGKRPPERGVGAGGGAYSAGAVPCSPVVGIYAGFPQGKMPARKRAGGGVWDQALWSSSHSCSAVGCQQAA